MVKTVKVGFFNAQGVLDHLQHEFFCNEVEEEWYSFSVDEAGTLFVYLNTDYYSRLVKVFASGRWAEVEYV